MKSTLDHWNRIYEETEEHRLGWYENDPAPTFDLLRQVKDWENSTIFLSGAGTSILVEHLLKTGARLILNDLSSEALDRLKNKLGDNAERAEWICQDIAHPLSSAVRDVDIWIDRAVLHFVTDEHGIEGYFKNLKTRLRVGGHALFAEFPPHGAPKCAGLELHRYSLEELAERLGDGFETVDYFDHAYINPAGDLRPYIYALFRRTA